MKRIVLFSGVNALTQQSVPKPWMPLSILTIGSYLKHNGFDPLLLDPQVHHDWRDELVRATADGALYIGVTCMTGPSIDTVLEAISIVRMVSPQTPIVWGGYHGTLRYHSILREGYADVVVRGPGEEAALALARVYEDHPHDKEAATCSFPAIPNIAYVGAADRGRVQVTKTARMPDMDALPAVDYSLLDPRQFQEEHDRRVPYISSYGCPYACSYCSEPVNSGRRWRPLSPRRILNEARKIASEYAPDVIDFMDPNFSSDPRRVVDFVDLVLRDGSLKVGFMCNMRARDVAIIADMMPIEHLAAAGFKRIFIGAESGSERMLSYLSKSSKPQHTLVACKQLSAAGIETWISFMHDLPTETPEESEETLDTAEQLMHLDGNYQSHHFYMPFPDTALFNEQFSHLDLTKLSLADWARSSTKGSLLWRGRPEFRNRVVDRLEQMKAIAPRSFSLTALPERPTNNGSTQREVPGE